MMQAAVPRSVADAARDFREAAPGHRFNLYFPIWDSGWRPDNQRKKDALRLCADEVPSRVAELLDALRERQQMLLKRSPTGLRIPAISTAPFATGLGLEHPVENGFAFLSPYGLPYLPGSGVKGILRRAAEEMALFPEEYVEDAATAPTLLDVWWLFGFEGASGAWWPLSQKEEKELSDDAKAGRAASRERWSSCREELANRSDLPEFIRRVIAQRNDRLRYLDNPPAFLRVLEAHRREIHNRGALSFWDAFPGLPKQGEHKGRLTVEIMTPHYTDYYQNGGTPNDAGQPTPIPFLAVPAGSSFDFHVVCEPERLPATLRETWKPTVEAIFRHAFDWLGFGAKTAIGYGVMQRDREREADEAQARAAREQQERERQEAQRLAQEKERALAQLDPVERSIHEFLDSRADKNQPEISAVISAVKRGHWTEQERPAVARWLQQRMKENRGQWKEQSKAKRPEKDREHQNTLQVLKWLGS